MRSGSDASKEITAKPTEFGEVMAATAGILVWLEQLIARGPAAALETSWILLIALLLGAWALLMRLRLDGERFAMTIGPWRRGVDVTALQSIAWKMTGGGRSRGTIFVHDQRGGRVPIYVGRFTGIDEWGPRLLDAAARCGATVDARSRHLLEGAGAPRTWRTRKSSDLPSQ
jgi:hypothetical protein